MLMGFAGKVVDAGQGRIGRISKSHRTPQKTEVIPQDLVTEANSSSPSAFEAWLKTYLEHLEEARIAPTSTDLRVSSFPCQDAR